MTEYTREIAKIERTFLGIEDHGVLTSYLRVTFGGGAVQGIGGYSLDAFRQATDTRIGTAEGMEFVRRVLIACGAESWEQLKGRTIYVLRDPGTWRVEGIEPLPTERGERFLFRDVFGDPS